MKFFKMKPQLIRTALGAILATFVAGTVITTASGCVFCRDCGPHRAWRHH